MSNSQADEAAPQRGRIRMVPGNDLVHLSLGVAHAGLKLGREQIQDHEALLVLSGDLGQASGKGAGPGG